MTMRRTVCRENFYSLHTNNLIIQNLKEKIVLFVKSPHCNRFQMCRSIYQSLSVKWTIRRWTLSRRMKRRPIEANRSIFCGNRRTIYDDDSVIGCSRERETEQRGISRHLQSCPGHHQSYTLAQLPSRHLLYIHVCQLYSCSACL